MDIYLELLKKPAWICGLPGLCLWRKSQRRLESTCFRGQRI